jgi:hypothetical protein
MCRFTGLFYFHLRYKLKLIVELWFCLHLRYEAEEVLGEDFDVIFTNKDKANGIPKRN